MKIRLTERLRKSYASAPQAVQKAFDKQLSFLAANLNHPSLRAKKYDETADIWQARVNRDWRFYFVIQNDEIVILGMRSHPK
jgi:plasmid maintenance system killer protein